jgi:hypothetical protein
MAPKVGRNYDIKSFFSNCSFSGLNVTFEEKFNCSYFSLFVLRSNLLLVGKKNEVYNHISMFRRKMLVTLVCGSLSKYLTRWGTGDRPEASLSPSSCRLRSRSRIHRRRMPRCKHEDHPSLASPAFSGFYKKIFSLMKRKSSLEQYFNVFSKIVK